MIVAKVKVKNLDAVRLRVQQTLDSVLDNKQMLTEVGKFSANRIKAFAKAGKPLNDKRRFPSLAELTVKNRKRLSDFNKTDSLFQPSKSNLTFTGQLLDSITFKINNDNSISIGPEGKRKPYKTGPKSSAKKTAISSRNEVLAKTLAEIGFIIAEASAIKEKDPNFQKRIKSIYLRFLRRALKVRNLLGS